MSSSHKPFQRRPAGGAARRALLAAAFFAAVAPAVAPAAAAAGPGETSGTRGPTDVETIFYNGRIHTMDASRPLVEALAVEGGRIVAAGSSRELLAGVPAGVRTIDLGGRAVIPGLTDAHAHFLGYAETAARIDLVGTRSLDRILDLVSERVKAARKGEWILGRGWDQNLWIDARYPDKAALDSVAPDNPVSLVRVCGHAAYANSAALRIAGIAKGTPDPPAGRILRDAAGEPTGILLDEAKEILSRLVPRPTREERKRLLVAAAHRCLAAGLVGVHEMGISAETVSLYRELYSAGELPFRITAYLSSDDPGMDSLLAKGPFRGFAQDRFSVIGAKFYADGSLGARSAALLAPYADDPGNVGILMAAPEDLYGAMLPWRERGFETAVHAIGDAAVREALDVYERLEAARPAPRARPRIEHAQLVSAEDVPRFAKLAVIPSMQFIHCTSDMSWVEERLGAARLAEAYPWRSLARAGSRIPGGSDFPVESIDPFLGIHAAVTRRSAAGDPPGGWRPEECLTLDEAVGAYTTEAAYAAGMEDVAGSLAPGKLADFIVLSDDVFSVNPDSIPRIRVLATILGGEIVHRSGEL